MVIKMKFQRLLSLFLAMLFCFQCAAMTVCATEDAESDPAAADTSETEAPPSESALPAETQPVIQQGFSEVVPTDIGIDALSSLAGPSDFDVDGAGVLLYEITSGTMVYAKNIDGPREPASLTKVMTALVALENGNLDEVITVSEAALANMDPDGSSSGLIVGEQLTLEQLLYCLLIESANDAASVIALHLGGSESGFVEMMNAKAKDLGCENTHFANPHGLHDAEHITTARDIGKIMLAALQYSKFQEIYSTDRFVLPATNLHEERIMVTTNFLIGTAITTDYYDSRVVGGKTGFTTPAGRCVVCVAEEDGLQYLCVVMGAQNIVTDDYATYGSFLTATELFDFGFDNFTFAEVLSPLAPVAQLPVAEATESVVVTPAESLTTMLPSGFEGNHLRTEYVLKNTDGLTAPLEAGEVVGVVREYYDNICVGQTDLVTMTAVTHRPMASAIQESVQEVIESPWKTVVIVLAVLLGALVLLFVGSAWYNSVKRKRRRRNRRPRQ